MPLPSAEDGEGGGAIPAYGLSGGRGRGANGRGTRDRQVGRGEGGCPSHAAAGWGAVVHAGLGSGAHQMARRGQGGRRRDAWGPSLWELVTMGIRRNKNRILYMKKKKKFEFVTCSIICCALF